MNKLSNEVSKFFKQILKSTNDKFSMHDNLHGEIILEDFAQKRGGNSKVHLSTGSVYGIFAIKKEGTDIDKLFQETQNSVRALDENNEVYPIYWGKDINPGSRIVVHSRPNPNTGNAKLEEIEALRNFRLIYGCIFVTNYKEFEKYLHTQYPPLVGSSHSGKGSKITIIDN